MTFIQHIVEPDRLLLSWQPPGGPDRGRHIVAELRREGDDADLVYLSECPDYQDACAKGFTGYPGLPLNNMHKQVVPIFLRRLPPRQRQDFHRFLDAIRIPPGTNLSDFALLGYAGAKLPSDDFVLIHPFDQAEPPFEFLLLIAGYRYYQEAIPYVVLKPGMTAEFEMEPENPRDPSAIRIFFPELSRQTAGYICRGLLPQFRRWMAEGWVIKSWVERLNGSTEHPLVYLYVQVISAGTGNSRV